MNLKLQLELPVLQYLLEHTHHSMCYIMFRRFMTSLSLSRPSPNITLTSISSRARPRPMSTVGPPPPSTTETPDSPYVRYCPHNRTIYLV